MLIAPFDSCLSDHFVLLCFISLYLICHFLSILFAVVERWRKLALFHIFFWIRAVLSSFCSRFLKDLNLREVQRLKVDVDILKRVEERISRWDFNAFEVSQITGDRPLYYTAVALLHRFQIQQRFPDILFTRLLAYIDRLESLYRDNPYHNKEHAADVTQTFAFLVVKANILQCVFQSFFILTCTFFLFLSCIFS